MRRVLLGILGLLGLIVAAVLVYGLLLFLNAGRGNFPMEAASVAARRPQGVLDDQAERQQVRRALVAREATPQILFGDLHVHTVYSADAHLQSMRIRERIGPNPPADACDFARFCSQLDFWSINDHAESLTPDLWRRTVSAVRQCNATAGDPAHPDLVSFLGWEWSHAAQRADEHYGHKNVVLRDTEEGRIPTRPIASVSGPPWVFLGMSVAPPAVTGNFAVWRDFHRYARDVIAVPDCPDGVPVRDLPEDCRESAADPQTLFAKLADWGHAALVIPHGLAWGITNPVHADLANQIGQHDPRWQRLLEVYSGHGNSEVYREFDWPRRDATGRFSCPAGGEDVELCCERAATLVRARCEDPASAACDAAVARAQQAAADRFGGARSLLSVVEGTTEADWGDCNQLRGSFLPAANYRPRQSAQYGFALASDAEGRPTDARFRWGLIGASDTHRSRPGTGYREFAREIMTDGIRYPIPDSFLDGRSDDYYYTGGLTAVHASGRDRGAIFEALGARRVYGTSGDRILLWFDLLDADGARHPMGSEVEMGAVPRFEVRAVGDWQQREGCADFVGEALPGERIAELCQGHCYHPSDERKRIRRIEVVRIRPQAYAEEPIRPRIEDPWRSFACDDAGQGCVVTFEDPDFPVAARETLYYVRAIQEASDAVNGDPLRCERDADGACRKGRACGRSADGVAEDCLAPVEERAWSSPIFLDPEVGLQAAE